MSQRQNRKSKLFDLPAYARGYDLGYKVVEAQKKASKPSLDLNNIVMLGSPSFVKGFRDGMKQMEQELKEPEMKKAVQDMLQDLQKRMPSVENPEFKDKWKDKEPDL